VNLVAFVSHDYGTHAQTFART